MSDAVVFYQLNAKFLERAEDIPSDAKQVVYYSLAIGHHVGVFDCFKPILRCPAAVYDQVVAAMPEGSAARRKLLGLHRFGEITIDCSHTALLKGAIATARTDATPEAGAWMRGLDAALDAIVQEPAIYLMGRRV